MSEFSSAAADLGAHPSPSYKREVIDLLRSRIFAGHLHSGDRIDQDELAGQLGISRLPVREALLVLEHDGLVRSIPRRGTFIRSLPEADIRVHFEIYGDVSAHAARRAVETLTDEKLGGLAATVDRIENGPTAEQWDLQFQFYREINQAASSAWLTRELRRMGRTLPARLVDEAARAVERRSGRYERDVLDALVARDGDRAGALISAGIRSTGETVINHLRASGFWAASAQGLSE